MSPDLSFVEFPRRALDEPIGTLFQLQAARHPERLAVKGRRHAFTYRELDAAANRLAHAILARRGPGPEPIALLFPHDAPAVGALLATLKAGKIYVALDSHLEAPKLRAIVEDAGARLLVCEAATLDRARAMAPPGCEVLDPGARADATAERAPEVAVSSRSLAAISYTSGSTGEPKGVGWDHRGILHLVMLLVNGARLAPEDRAGLLQSMAVASSYRRVLGPLLTGAAVLPFDLRAERSDALGPWLIGERITMCAFAASVFRHLAGGMSDTETFPALRRVWLQSEPVLRGDVELFRKRFPADCVLVTGLATSEAGVVRELIVDEAAPLGQDFVPIGYAVPDKEVTLLDDEGHPVGEGDVGEIVVRSEYLARGYWRRPDLDRRVFSADRSGGAARVCRTGDLGRLLPDGCLLLLGRKDARAKLRGRFVDTSEIETTLLGHAGLRGAAVMIREDQPGHQRLVAYVVPAAGATPTVTELRDLVQDTLGTQLVPAAIVYLAALPRTPNGKIDRRALPAPGRARPPLATPYEAPRTPVEEAVARIWAEVLDLAAVGIGDDFLELGGASLLVGRIAARVSQHFGVEMPVQELMGLARVKDIAVAVVERLVRQAGPAQRRRILSSLGDASPELPAD